MNEEQLLKKIKIYQGNEEELVKRLKRYKWVVFTLVSLLFLCVGYSYSLRLDINRLEEKVEYQYDLIVNSYIRNIHNSLFEKFERLK